MENQIENPGMLCTGENCGAWVYAIHITADYDWLCDDCYAVHVEDIIVAEISKEVYHERDPNLVDSACRTAYSGSNCN